MDIPMLDDVEYELVGRARVEGMDFVERERRRRGILPEPPHSLPPQAESLRPMLEMYRLLTGFPETNPAALGHHRISIQGPPCRSCGRPLRTREAAFCAACGWEPEGGDREFREALAELPPPVRRVGLGLLNRVRAWHDSELEFREKSGKFVEQPNFWTVKVQAARARNLRITIYGQPHEFGPWRQQLELRDDRPGYSAFLLERADQVDAAAAVIRMAWVLKQSR